MAFPAAAAAHTFLTANVTSAGEHWERLLTAQWAVAALQEARLRYTHPVTKDLQARGGTLVLSEPQHNGESLVGILAREGSLVAREPPLGVSPMWVAHALWYAPSGEAWRIISLYVPPRTVADAAFAAARSCLAFAQETPEVPTLLVGDLNEELEGHPLEALFQQHGWHNPLCGQPTSDAAAEPRRIDWLLYNRPAGWRAGVSWLDRSLRLPVHAAQWLQLPAGAPQAVP